MRYFRKNVDGEWKTFKISKDESQNLLRLTARKCIEILKIVKDSVDGPEEKTYVGDDEIKIIFDKLAPTYKDIVNDYIDQNVEKKRLEEEASKHPKKEESSSK